jgi:peptidyl-prolyl cis-trans isomerase B (cyclophilin B)
MTARNLLLISAFLLPLVSFGASPTVLLETSEGNIKIEMTDNKDTKKTVENFLRYVKEGHYNDLIFHRVIKGFMIQGGGFDSNMGEKKAKHPSIKNEAYNGLENVRGTIAMARTNDPHSAGAQFFINTVDNKMLNHTAKDGRGWGYAVFGKVVDGMKVVDKIEAVNTTRHPSGHSDVPAKAVVIKKATIVGAKISKQNKEKAASMKGSEADKKKK